MKMKKLSEVPTIKPESSSLEVRRDIEAREVSKSLPPAPFSRSLLESTEMQLRLSPAHFPSGFGICDLGFVGRRTFGELVRLRGYSFRLWPDRHNDSLKTLSNLGTSLTIRQNHGLFTYPYQPYVFFWLLQYYMLPSTHRRFRA